MRVDRKAVIVATVAMVATVVLVNPPTAMAATSLRVLDWNIAGGASAEGGPRWDEIVNTIAAVNADVVTLQEVHNDAGLDVNGDGLANGINQYQALLDRFPAYDGHYARGDYSLTAGNAGCKADPRKCGSAGNLILSKYPIAETNGKVSYRLPNEPGCEDDDPYDSQPDPPFNHCPVNRSMGGVRVSIGGQDMRIYSTHLSNGDGASAVDRRQRQARYILDTLPASLMTTPMLFTGDLNLRPDGTVRSWLADAGWVDMWTQVKDNIGADVVTHPGSGDDARIDYVYGTGVIDVSDAYTFDRTASDHRPVAANLTIHSTPAVATGGVLAGAEGRAGWANLTAYQNGSAKLRVCDNKPDGWGVRAYLYEFSAPPVLVVTGRDPAYADLCGTFNVPDGTFDAPRFVNVCLYRGGDERDCRSEFI